MKVYYILFDRNFYKSAINCLSWIDNKGYTPIERVKKTEKTYKYTINRPTESMKLKVLRIERGIIFLVGR